MIGFLLTLLNKFQEIDIKNQNQPFAFIQYSDISSVVKAMRKFDNETVGGIKLKLGFGKSFATSCIWISEICDAFLDEKTFLSQVKRYGNIKNCVMNKDDRSALVFYETSEDAKKAADDLRSKTLNGQRLQVDFASRDFQTFFMSRHKNELDSHRNRSSVGSSWFGGNSNISNEYDDRTYESSRSRNNLPYHHHQSSSRLSSLNQLIRTNSSSMGATSSYSSRSQSPISTLAAQFNSLSRGSNPSFHNNASRPKYDNYHHDSPRSRQQYRYDDDDEGTEESHKLSSSKRDSTSRYRSHHLSDNYSRETSPYSTYPSSATKLDSDSYRNSRFSNSDDLKHDDRRSIRYHVKPSGRESPSSLHTTAPQYRKSGSSNSSRSSRSPPRDSIKVNSHYSTRNSPSSPSSPRSKSHSYHDSIDRSCNDLSNSDGKNEKDYRQDSLLANQSWRRKSTEDSISSYRDHSTSDTVQSRLRTESISDSMDGVFNIHRDHSRDRYRESHISRVNSAPHDSPSAAYQNRNDSTLKRKHSTLDSTEDVNLNPAERKKRLLAVEKITSITSGNDKNASTNSGKSSVDPQITLFKRMDQPDLNNGKHPVVKQRADSLSSNSDALIKRRSSSSSSSSSNPSGHNSNKLSDLKTDKNQYLEQFSLDDPKAVMGLLRHNSENSKSVVAPPQVNRELARGNSLTSCNSSLSIHPVNGNLKTKCSLMTKDNGSRPVKISLRSEPVVVNGEIDKKDNLSQEDPRQLKMNPTCDTDLSRVSQNNNNSLSNSKDRLLLRIPEFAFNVKKSMFDGLVNVQLKVTSMSGALTTNTATVTTAGNLNETLQGTPLSQLNIPTSASPKAVASSIMSPHDDVSPSLPTRSRLSTERLSSEYSSTASKFQSNNGTEDISDPDASPTRVTSVTLNDASKDSGIKFNAWSGSVNSSTVAPKLDKTPTIDYSKYNIKKKSQSMTGGSGSGSRVSNSHCDNDSNDIFNLLSKSVFDQDSKRLNLKDHYKEKLESKDSSLDFESLVVSPKTKTPLISRPKLGSTSSSSSIKDVPSLTPALSSASHALKPTDNKSLPSENLGKSSSHSTSALVSPSHHPSTHPLHSSSAVPRSKHPEVNRMQPAKPNVTTSISNLVAPNSAPVRTTSASVFSHFARSASSTSTPLTPTVSTFSMSKSALPSVQSHSVAKPKDNLFSMSNSLHSKSLDAKGENKSETACKAESQPKIRLASTSHSNVNSLKVDASGKKDKDTAADVKRDHSLAAKNIVASSQLKSDSSKNKVEAPENVHHHNDSHTSKHLRAEKRTEEMCKNSSKEIATKQDIDHKEGKKHDKVDKTKSEKTERGSTDSNGKYDAETLKIIERNKANSKLYKEKMEKFERKQNKEKNRDKEHKDRDKESMKQKMKALIKAESRKNSSKSRKEKHREKNRDEKCRKSELMELMEHFGDEPIYLSMYDKVKARSSANQTIKVTPHDSVRHNLEKSKDHKHKGNDDSNSDSDSDADDKMIKQQKKMKKHKKLFLFSSDSSSDEEVRSKNLKKRIENDSDSDSVSLSIKKSDKIGKKKSLSMSSKDGGESDTEVAKMTKFSKSKKLTETASEDSSDDEDKIKMKRKKKIRKDKERFSEMHKHEKSHNDIFEEKGDGEKLKNSLKQKSKVDRKERDCEKDNKSEQDAEETFKSNKSAKKKKKKAKSSKDKRHSKEEWKQIIRADSSSDVSDMSSSANESFSTRKHSVSRMSSSNSECETQNHVIKFYSKEMKLHDVKESKSRSENLVSDSTKNVVSGHLSNRNEKMLSNVSREKENKHDRDEKSANRRQPDSSHLSSFKKSNKEAKSYSKENLEMKKKKKKSSKNKDKSRKDSDNNGMVTKRKDSDTRTSKDSLLSMNNKSKLSSPVCNSLSLPDSGSQKLDRTLQSPLPKTPDVSSSRSPSFADEMMLQHEDGSSSSESKIDEELINNVRLLGEGMLANNDDSCDSNLSSCNSLVTTLDKNHSQDKVEKLSPQPVPTYSDNSLDKSLLSSHNTSTHSRSYEDEAAIQSLLQKELETDHNRFARFDKQAVVEERVFTSPSSIAKPENTSCSFIVPEMDFKCLNNDPVKTLDFTSIVEIDNQRKMEDDRAVAALLEDMNDPCESSATSLAENRPIGVDSAATHLDDNVSNFLSLIPSRRSSTEDQTIGTVDEDHSVHQPNVSMSVPVIDDQELKAAVQEIELSGNLSHEIIKQQNPLHEDIMFNDDEDDEIESELIVDESVLEKSFQDDDSPNNKNDNFDNKLISDNENPFSCVKTKSTIVLSCDTNPQAPGLTIPPSVLHADPLAVAREKRSSVDANEIHSFRPLMSPPSSNDSSRYAHLLSPRLSIDTALSEENRKDSCSESAVSDKTDIEDFDHSIESFASHDCPPAKTKQHLSKRSVEESNDEGESSQIKSKRGRKPSKNRKSSDVHSPRSEFSSSDIQSSGALSINANTNQPLLSPISVSPGNLSHNSEISPGVHSNKRSKTSHSTYAKVRRSARSAAVAATVANTNTVLEELDETDFSLDEHNTENELDTNTNRKQQSKRGRKKKDHKQNMLASETQNKSSNSVYDVFEFRDDDFEEDPINMDLVIKVVNQSMNDDKLRSSTGDVSLPPSTLLSPKIGTANDALPKDSDDYTSEVRSDNTIVIRRPKEENGSDYSIKSNEDSKSNDSQEVDKNVRKSSRNNKCNADEELEKTSFAGLDQVFNKAGSTEKRITRSFRKSDDHTPPTFDENEGMFQLV